MTHDETVLDPVAKFVLTVVWLTLSAVPSLVLLVLGVRLRASSGADAGVFLLPLSWCVTAGLSSPIYARLLGQVEVVEALPPTQRALHHLPPACARLVEEAEAIRMDLSDLDQALLRAWRLAQELEAATPDVRMVLESSGATLQPVDELLRMRSDAGRSRLANVRVHERLDAALSSFADALARPNTTAFR